MALDPTVEAELGTKLDEQAAKLSLPRGAWASIEYIKTGPNITGFRASFGMMDGFSFTFSDVNVWPGDVDALMDKFCQQPLEEIRARHNAAKVAP